LSLLTRERKYIMKKHFLFSSIFILCIGNVLAFEQSDQAMELAQNGVVSKSASGETQTTVVDENGNLKIVPVSPSKKKPAANSMKQVEPIRPPISGMQGAPIGPHMQEALPPGQRMAPGMPVPPPEQQMEPGMSVPPPEQQMEPGMSVPPPGQQTEPGMPVPPPGQQTEPGMQGPPSGQQGVPGTQSAPAAPGM
jgi:hypothetical protein